MSNPTTQSKPSRSVDWKAYFSVMQLFASIAIVLAVLGWLLWAPSKETSDNEDGLAKSKPVPAVEAESFGCLSIDRNSPLGQRLPIQTLRPIATSEPLLNVTGRVIASRRPGDPSKGELGKKDFWQFNSGDLLNDFSAWEKATADVAFNQSQLKQIRELAVSKEAALEDAISRLEKLVRSGSESGKDLISQRSLLLQTQIQNRKDIYQAELAISIADREARTLALQLLQSGLDPEQLEHANSDMDIVTAEVPEAMIERVAVGQLCTASFFGIGDIVFDGKLTSISPILSAEQHTLRVLFVVHDPQDRLRPGMFARIGLGTDARGVLKIPAESVIHVGKDDLVMVVDDSTSSGSSTQVDSTRLHLRVVPVVISDLINGQVNVIKGLKEGDQIVADNAILLQPLVVSSYRLPKETRPIAQRGSESK